MQSVLYILKPGNDLQENDFKNDFQNDFILEFALQDFILDFATLKNALKLLLFALDEGSSELEWDNIASVARLLEKYSRELDKELQDIEKLLLKPKLIKSTPV